MDKQQKSGRTLLGRFLNCFSTSSTRVGDNIRIIIFLCTTITIVSEDSHPSQHNSSSPVAFYVFAIISRIDFYVLFIQCFMFVLIYMVSLFRETVLVAMKL